MYVTSRETTAALVQSQPSPLAQSLYRSGMIEERVVNNEIGQVLSNPSLDLAEKLTYTTAAFITKETPMVEWVRKLIV